MDPPANRPSRSFTLFQTLAEELALKLEAVPTSWAAKLGDEARELAGLFKDWTANPPIDSDRVKLIQQFMDFSREANEYLATIRKPSLPP